MNRSSDRAAFATALLLAAVSGCAGKKADPAPTPAVVPAAVVGATPTAEPAGTVVPTGGGPSIALPKPPKARNDQQLLTRDVILGTQYTNLYDVIQALRGNWLRVRTGESIQGKSSTVQVYLDNQRLTGADELRNMAPTNIASVRYYDPIQASSRWGMDHGAGAIYILTAKP